jgi:hypothetical protein
MEGLMVDFNVALKLVQAVFKLGVIQSLHYDRTGLGHPEFLACIQDIIFQITLLSDPQGSARAADHITTPITFDPPQFVP